MNSNQNSPLNSPEPAPACLGNLFRDFSQLAYNRTAEGGAFDECHRPSMAKLLLELKLDRYS